MRHFFTFNGKNSKDFNVWISGGGTYDAPERDVSMITVPGRNGDLTMDNGRFKNVTMTYPAFIPKDFPQNFAAFRSFMKSKIGYQRLEDTYDPDVFYQAIMVDNFDPETTALNRAASFNITFNRKPQRWLKSGQKFGTTITSNYTIHNPTDYEALPIIRVVGTGTFYVGDAAVEVDVNTVYTDINSDIQDCYYGLNNLNGNVIMLSGHFPTLPPGNTTINPGTVTSLQIQPNWWTI